MQEKVIIPANEENHSCTKKHLKQPNKEYAERLHFQLKGMDFTPNKHQSRTDYVRGSNGTAALAAVKPSSYCDRGFGVLENDI
eukprot:6388898-Ditylum_brightwellii.AAC.1